MNKRSLMRVNLKQSDDAGAGKIRPNGELPVPASNDHWTILKQALLGVVFVALVLPTASHEWEGAPPCYLPVGLAAPALMLFGGKRYYPVVFFASVLAARVKDHRPFVSWCGLPGAVTLYVGYAGEARPLSGRGPMDPRLGRLRDVGRFVAVFLAAVFSAITGTLTLLGDGLAKTADALRIATDWWASDAIAIVTITPFLLVYLVPQLKTWMCPGPAAGGRRRAAHSPREVFWSREGKSRRRFRIDRCTCCLFHWSGQRCDLVCRGRR